MCCGPGSVVGRRSGNRIPVGARFSAPVQTGPGAYPASCTMSTGSFPGVKSGRGVTLTLRPLLVPWSRESTAILLLPLRAVRPVQSLSACKRVHCTLPFTPMYVACFVPRMCLQTAIKVTRAQNVSDLNIKHAYTHKERATWRLGRQKGGQKEPLWNGLGLLPKTQYAKAQGSDNNKKATTQTDARAARKMDITPYDTTAS